MFLGLLGKECQMKKPAGLFRLLPARLISLTEILRASQSHPFQAAKKHLREDSTALLNILPSPSSAGHIINSQ